MEREEEAPRSVSPPPPPEALPIRFRAMAPGDVAAVVAIERDAFSTPWREDTFHSLIGHAGTELLVVELEFEIIAYAVLSLVLDQGELANIAVRKDRRGHGIGGLLLDHVIERVGERGIRELFLEVRQSNVNALTLYGTRGFVSVGRRKNYYESPREDALVLLKRIDG